MKNEVWTLTLIIWNISFIYVNSNFLALDNELNDFTNMNTWLQSFRMLNSKESKEHFEKYEKSINEQFPMSMRFKQTNIGISESKGGKPKSGDALNGNGGFSFLPFLEDTKDIKVQEDLLFGNAKDQEIQRKEGLLNGQILNSGKKTANVETEEFKNLYYDLIE